PLLTNHAHVLLCVARNPSIRLREIGDCVGVTERAAHRIVGDLEREGYLSRKRVGRRNLYEIREELPLCHELEAHVTVAQLVDLFSGDDAAPSAAA
ncbi:MAG TPA: MarR family transcriptional regulator, partial [Solirubrobacteraceae bacterium]|nr:MarR family transcriptional regulator [Solirubrobacteraceae bacterium]